MPLPVVPGGAPVGVPGAPPPGGPTGDPAEAAGFDALFQQLTGRALAGALVPGAMAPGDALDGDVEPAATADPGERAADAAAVAAMPVAVPVVPTPVEWIWTQPAPAPVDGPVADGTNDGAPIAPGLPVGGPSFGTVGAAQPVARRGSLGESPVFGPVAAPESRGESPVAAPVPGPGAPVGPAPVETPGPLPAAVTAPQVLPSAPAEGSSPTVPANPVPAGGASETLELVDAAPVARPDAPASPTTIAASPDARPEGPAFTPLPGAPGADRSSQARALGDVRQSRARAAAEETAAVEGKAPSAPTSGDTPVAVEVTAPAIPMRRPLPAGALAAMERLAATPASSAGTPAAPAAVRTDEQATTAAPAHTAGQHRFSSGDGFGSRGRDGGQPAPERVAAGPSFRLADTPAASLGVGAPGLERAATGQPLTAASDLPPVRELEPALADAVHQQIVRSIRMQWTGSLGEARVSLKPEFLGEVTASIHVERGVVTATLHADTPEVRTFIESHAASLRDALVEHGLRLDKLDVAAPEREPQTASDRQPQGRRRPQQEAQPKPRRREAEPGATFEFVSE